MKKTLTTRPFLVALSGVLICAAANINAQSYSESYGPASGYLSQGGDSDYSTDPAMLNNDCVPVATANGLAYLYGLNSAAFTVNPEPASPDPYSGVNALISAMGTSDNAAGQVAGTTASSTPGLDGAFTGLQTYLSTYAPTVTSSQVFNPTASSLASALAANSAVQLGILWGTINAGTFSPINGADTGGGHFVSLTGINLTAGTMTAIDPWGPVTSSANAGTTATTVTLTIAGEVSLGSSTVLEVTYPYSANSLHVADNTTQDGTGATSYGSAHYWEGYIAVDDIESVSAVPEPTTMSLLLAPLGAGLLRMLRKNRTA